MVTLDIQESYPIQVQLRFNNLYQRSSDRGITIICQWDLPLLQFDISKAIVTESDRANILGFFDAIEGRKEVFRYSDPTDNFATGTETIGVNGEKTQGVAIANSTGLVYQLFKTYEINGIKVYRPITRPVNNANFDISVAGQYQINWDLGRLTFDSSQGSQFTWSGDFDVPCRMANDSIELIRKVDESNNIAYWDCPSFVIQEVLERPLVEPAIEIGESLNHIFALRSEIERVETRDRNTSIEIFDSGYERRDGNWGSRLKRYRTPVRSDSFKSDIDYIVALWRVTRGGAVSFGYDNLDVNCRGELTIQADSEDSYTIETLELIELASDLSLSTVFSFNFQESTGTFHSEVNSDIYNISRLNGTQTLLNQGIIDNAPFCQIDSGSNGVLNKRLRLNGNLNLLDYDIIGWSLSVWIYNEVNGNKTYFIIGNNRAADSSTAIVLWYSSITEPMQFAIRYSNNTVHNVNSGTSTSIETLSQWNHIVITWNRSGNDKTAKVYFNGILTATSTNSTPDVTLKNTSALNFNLGGSDPLNDGADGNRGFTGRFDLFTWFDRPITQTEVNTLYNNGNGLQYPFTPD